MTIAWCEGCTISESRSYENQAIEYYYLGDLEKSEYYNERYLRGKTENNNSMAKLTAVN